MKKFFKSIGRFFVNLGKNIAKGFVWMAKNKIKVMQWCREVLITIVPLIFIVAFPIHFILKYLAKNSFIPLQLVLVGCGLLGLYFVLSAVYYILKAQDNKKLKLVESEITEKKAEQEQELEQDKLERKAKRLEMTVDQVQVIEDKKKKSKKDVKEKTQNKSKNFFGLVREKLLFHGNSIRFALTVVCAVASLFMFFTIFTRIHYWDIYFYYTILLWIILVYGLVELVLSQNLKTFIAMAIGQVSLLVLMCIVTPKATSMYFDLAGYTNTNEYDIYMLAITLITMLPLRVGMANGYIEKTKRSRNFGVGLICLAGGIIMHYTPIVTKILNDSYKDVPIWERVANQSIPYKIMFIVFIVMLVLVVLNISINFFHYIKKRNYLGLFDLACGVTGMVLACNAMYVMSNYLILFGR